MKRGKNICNALKAIRLRIADNNGIAYAPRECHHEGDCNGTCPACEAEVQYIENCLRTRRASGLATTVTGIALGMTTIVPSEAAAQDVIKQDGDTARVTKDTISIAEREPKDLAPDDSTAIIVRGIVCDDDNEPLIGAAIILKQEEAGSKRLGQASDINGQFAVRVPQDAVLSFQYIGYETKEIPVKELMKESSPFIVLEASLTGLLGEVMVTRPNYDDVYGRGKRK